MADTRGEMHGRLSNAPQEKEPHFSQKLWWLGIIADVAAVLSVLVGPGKNLVAAAGLVALLLGITQFIARRRKPVDWWTVLAVVGIVAGSVSIAVIADRSLTGSGGLDGRDAASPASTTTGPQANSSSVGIAGTSIPAATTTSTIPSAAAGPASVSLVSAVPVDTAYHGFAAGSLKVNGVKYSSVKSVGLDCIYVSETHQLDRGFRTFESKIGLGDDTVSGYSVRFTVFVDGEARASEVVEVGEVKTMTADVTNAFRVVLHVDLATDGCANSNTVAAAWIDPVIVR